MNMSATMPLVPVVREYENDGVYRKEWLACGHSITTYVPQDRLAKRRRCHKCALSGYTQTAREGR